MKKRMSSMTAHEFVQATSDLAVNYREIARLLGKSAGMVSCYASGKYGIPQDVANHIGVLLREKAKAIAERGLALHVGNITEQPEEYKPYVHRGNTKGRLLWRMREPDLSLLPAIRLSRRQTECGIRALRAWAEKMRLRAKNTSNETYIEEYTREIHDIRCIAERWPRGAQDRYEIILAKVEWQVMSRALRSYAETELYAGSLYQSWRRFYQRGGIDGRRFRQGKGKQNAAE